MFRCRKSKGAEARANSENKTKEIKLKGEKKIRCILFELLKEKQAI